MKLLRRRIVCSTVLCTVQLLGHAVWGQGNVEMWLSTEDGQHSLTRVADLEWSGGRPGKGLLFEVDPSKTYQSIVGLGASFEHATCSNLFKLSPEARTEVLTKLVDPERGIGMNLMRICIGTSDFVGEDWYSYNDLPPGETDPGLEHFSIDRDRAYVLPVLKEALSINPELRFVASPWSPPGWMKSNGSMLGGRLLREHYETYARYLVKFLRAYEAEGIPILAMTPQNEPGFPNPHYPTCQWTGAEQRDFIAQYLGPALSAEALNTPIWCWDHNWNFPSFPRTVLSDPAAARFVDGTAFHFYEGKVEAQSELKAEFPEKHIYFTEGSAFRTPGALRIISILRHWARSYNAWVVMLDEHRKPNNGPHNASATCIELKGDLTVEYRFDYYMYGHFMKFIARGALRIDSTPGDRLTDALLFRNPDGQIIAVAANAAREMREFQFRVKGKTLRVPLPAQSVATLRWSPDSD